MAIRIDKMLISAHELYRVLESFKPALESVELRCAVVSRPSARDTTSLRERGHVSLMSSITSSVLSLPQLLGMFLP